MGLHAFLDYEHNNAPMLGTQMRSKVLKYAEKRLKKSGASDDTQGAPSQVQLVQHSQFELGRLLGQGSFSSVYEIRAHHSRPQHADDQEERRISADTCVVKVLRKELLSKPSMLSACAADLAKEGLIMASLQHEHILSVKAWAECGLQGFESGRHDSYFLVLERLSDTLSDRLKQWQKQSDRLKFNLIQRGKKKSSFLCERLQVALSLADAMEYMHSKRILHRDLKPDNIGYHCSTGSLKIFDFDVARIIPASDEPDDTFLLTKHVGSPRYMSPECAKGEGYNLKADVYSFGLLLHELMSLEKPYDDISPADHDEMVFHLGVRPSIHPSWPLTIQSLMHVCWSQNIASRPTMKQVHAILRENMASIVSRDREVRNQRPWSIRRGNGGVSASDAKSVLQISTCKTNDELSVQ